MRRLLTAIAFGSAVVVIPLSIATVVLAAFLTVDTWNGHGKGSGERTAKNVR